MRTRSNIRDKATRAEPRLPRSLWVARTMLLSMAAALSCLGACRGGSGLPESCDEYLEAASSCSSISEASLATLRTRLTREKNRERLSKQCSSGRAALQQSCSAR